MNSDQQPTANSQQPKTPRVFVSGCYDLLHSGHVEFFQQASQFGDLYVGIGSDATYLEYKHRKPMFPQEERLFMVKNIKAVKEAVSTYGSQFENIYYTDAGCTVSCHCGPGTLGVLFVRK